MSTGRRVGDPAKSSGLDFHYNTDVKDRWYHKLFSSKYEGNNYRRVHAQYSAYLHNDDRVRNGNLATYWNMTSARRKFGKEPLKQLAAMFTKADVSLTDEKIEKVFATIFRSYIQGTSEYDARVGAGDKPSITIDQKRIKATEQNIMTKMNSAALRDELFGHKTYEAALKKHLISDASLDQHFSFRWIDAWSEYQYGAPYKFKPRPSFSRRLLSRLNVFKYAMPVHWYVMFHEWWNGWNLVKQLRYNFYLKQDTMAHMNTWHRLLYHYYDPPSHVALRDPTLGRYPMYLRPYIAKIRGRSMRVLDLWFNQLPLSHPVIAGTGLLAMAGALYYGWQYFRDEHNLIDERLKPWLSKTLENRKHGEISAAEVRSRETAEAAWNSVKTGATQGWEYVKEMFRFGSH